MTDNGNGTYSLLVKVAAGYTVYEKTAPAGYKLDADANNNKVDISFTQDELAQNGQAVADKNVQLTNAKVIANDLPALPLTGAMGQVLLTVAGVAVLAMAAGTLFVAYKRRKQEN